MESAEVSNTPCFSCIGVTVLDKELIMIFSNSTLDLISELPPILAPCQRSTKFITKLVSPKRYFSKLPSSILAFLVSISEISTR